MNKLKKLVQPYVLWIVIMLVVPMLLIGLNAFLKNSGDSLSVQFTLDNFKRFFSDSIFINVLLHSLNIAILTTVFCLIIGYPCAYVISKLHIKSQMFWVLLITLPTWINMLVKTYAWVGILGDNGIINQFLASIHLSKLHLLHTNFAVILGMVYNFLPFMILQIHTSLTKIDYKLVEASHDLGATNWQTFKKVILPLSIPGIISGITLVFLPALSSFFIPKLLGGGEQVLIGNLIENYFVVTGDWGFGSAISFIMAIVIMISMMFTNKLEKKEN